MPSDPIIPALHRLLERDGIDGHPIWIGNSRTLFWALTIDDAEYRAVVDRPHDAGGIRKLIKKLAVEIHKAGIIVGLAKRTITLDTTNAKVR